MVILEQIETLVSYLEGRPDLAHGHLSRTKERRWLVHKLWSECAQLLNSVNNKCPKKSPEHWRLFYNDYKSKLIKKIKKQKRELSAEDFVPGRKTTLTPLQERLYAVLKRGPKGLWTENEHSTCSDPQITEDSTNTAYNPETNTITHTHAENQSVVNTPNERIELQPSIDYEHSYATNEEPTLQQKRLNANKKCVRRRKVKIRPNNQHQKVMPETNSALSFSDEFHFFALNVAAQLRALPLHSALQIQVKIQDELYRARIEASQTNLQIYYTDSDDNSLDICGVEVLKEEDPL